MWKMLTDEIEKAGITILRGTREVGPKNYLHEVIM
jgi:hypothetical protein